MDTTALTDDITPELSISEAFLLLWVRLHGPVRQADLPTTTPLSRGGASDVARSLAERGLIERQPRFGRAQALVLYDPDRHDDPLS